MELSHWLAEIGHRINTFASAWNTHAVLPGGGVFIILLLLGSFLPKESETLFFEILEEKSCKEKSKVFFGIF